MATVMVGQGLRNLAEQALKDAKVRVTRQGYTDSSTTTWGLVVNTKKTVRQLQNIIWDAIPGVWCSVTKANGPLTY